MATFFSKWSRREVLETGTFTALSSLLGFSVAACSPTRSTQDQSRPHFRTALCDLLGIDIPILQAPMSRIVTPQMVAAVSEAGGMGILAGIAVPPEVLRQQIQTVRELTDRPFGVNLILHEDILSPADPSSIDGSTVSAVQATLNQFRKELGITPHAERPGGFPDVIDAAFEVILEERVPIFSIGLGKPSLDMVAQCHGRGMKVIAMASTVSDAVELSETGVDVIIAQGSEAGGHRSTWTRRSSPEEASIGTMTLVPQVVQAVPQPVIAAGGISNGKGLLASLALGAEGILMGTRFIASEESAAPEFYKRELVARNSDATVMTDAFTGLYARVLRNKYVTEYRESGAPVFPAGIQQVATSDITSASASTGTGDFYPMYAGQGIGMIEAIPGAAAIVQDVMEEARQEFDAMMGRIAPGVIASG